MIPQKAIDLVKQFEGYRGEAYQCPAGLWTIGWGTTVYPSRVKVAKGDTCTEEEADVYLEHDLSHCMDRIAEYVDVPLNSNETAALCSFIYNLGAGAFSASTLLKLINAGDFEGAAKQFGRWNKSQGKVLPGLTRRREAERDLFLSQAF